MCEGVGGWGGQAMTKLQLVPLVGGRLILIRAELKETLSEQKMNLDARICRGLP